MSIRTGILIFLVAWLIHPAIAEISYNRQIRPILSDNCFFCHGPDQNTREAKLRLDIRDEAIKEVIVPGKPEESEFIKRIFTKDEDDVMPPIDSHKKLTTEQKELLRAWITEGAKYEGHWAYTPPAKPATPASQNGVDFLVRERQTKLGLKAAPEADRRTLIRRLYFDLIGLPPRPEEVDAFEKDKSPNAYAALVDRLLNRPEYGERMAIPWLDVVRFADTIGYHSDNPRNVWPYRDYVINSFNANKPFDRFTREQLAGDLLPEASQETRVASAFNRLLLSTEEGGAQAKDYESRMLTDRVRAVGAVWLGQTIGCAQCHDHKFDPITMRDFYSMGAFFADIKEPIIGRREEGMLVPDKDQASELTRLDEAKKQLQAKFDGPHPNLAEAFEQWERSKLTELARETLWTPLLPAKADSAEGAKLEVQPDGAVFVRGKKPNTDTYTLTYAKPVKDLLALRLEALSDESLPAKGPGRAGNGNFVVSEIVATLIKGEESRVIEFAKAEASFEQALWTAASLLAPHQDGRERGWAILPGAGKTHHLVLHLKSPLTLQEGESLRLEIKQMHGHGSHTLGKFRLSATTRSAAIHAPPQPQLSAELQELLLSPTRDAAQKEKLFAAYKAEGPELAELRQQLADANKAYKDFEGSIGRCLVSISSEQPRTVRILPRGNWMNEDGEIVKPALPEYLAGKHDPDKKLTRLDLADWLVSRENPLTARVVMNRLWKQFFGVGLSKVLDDLGAQGEPPPNQALLDWLACEFMDSGWDYKQMVRVIVNSATYKQSSIPSPDLKMRDPENRELAAQSRWRLDAELVRDNALAISGLLVAKIGGPSVKPYQPDGYWENLNFPVRTWEHSTGQDQYRRGLYTWWQRSFLHPSMLAFDAPSREECAAERNRSNIPQQALVLLNDPTYVEAARAFATRILTEGGQDAKSRLQWAWKQALGRSASSEEVATVEALLSKHLQEYTGDMESAKAYLNVGLNPVPANLNPAELAAWTNAARVILNLHETITRS